MAKIFPFTLSPSDDIILPAVTVSVAANARTTRSKAALDSIVELCPMRMRRVVDDETFRRLCRARDYAQAYFASPIDTQTLAREPPLSTWHFHRLFAGTFGSTPHDFLTHLRIERAKRLLASGSVSVTETCFEAGYSSVGSFSSKFRSVVGV